jgi:pyruvate/2-oxoglutarate dehydrogenase complex dihydrolipoamide dehydrogenase (E3) component
LARFRRPGRFDRNLIVIGAGAAGLVAAYVAAAARAKVTLIEANRMGGDCLNTGCVPSKALIRTCRLLGDLNRAESLGLTQTHADVDFAQVMARVRRVIETVAPHDSVERYTELGVDCIQGRAELVSPWSVRVGDRELSARAIILATGARPVVPPIPGLADLEPLTSESLWSLERLPDPFVVLGGGPVGCEMAQCFARLGARVTLIEQAPGLLPREDPEVGEALAARLETEGVRLLLGARVEGFERVTGGGRMRWRCDGANGVVGFDRVLVAIGRRPQVEGLGLERLGIPLTERGTVVTDAYLRTPVPSIYACGDLAGPYQLTHAASHQAWHAAVNALMGSLWRFRVDYSALPQAVYTEPEVARVGRNEAEARQLGLDYEVTRLELAELDRAIAEEAPEGFVKLLTVPGRDRLLGATLVGGPAAEMVNELTTAMRHGLGLNRLLGTIHAYPTFSEGNKLAAGAWKRAHLDSRLLRLAGWLNARRLGG